MANYGQILTSDKTTPKVRDERIDSVKYWIMLLVIAGHVFMCEEFSNIHACVVTWEWIYMFHMPLFVFISGYFSRKKDKKKLKANIWKLLEPLIIFQGLGLLGKYFFFGSISLNSIIVPWFALWYLLSLVYWRAILQIIPDRILNNIKLILIITFCLSVLPCFLPPDNILSIRKTLTFMPFFFLGYYMRGKNIFIPKKYKPLSFIFLLLTMSIPIFYSDYLVGNLAQIDPYYIYRALRITIGWVLAILMSIAFINVCPNTRWSANQGMLTMQYFIYHAIIIPPLRIIARIFNFPFTFSSAVICTIVITIGIGIILYYPLFRELTHPISFLLMMRKNNRG